MKKPNYFVLQVMICNVFVCNVWKAAGLFAEIGDEVFASSSFNLNLDACYTFVADNFP